MSKIKVLCFHFLLAFGWPFAASFYGHRRIGKVVDQYNLGNAGYDLGNAGYDPYESKTLLTSARLEITLGGHKVR